MKSNLSNIVLGCFMASLFFACSEEVVVEQNPPSAEVEEVTVSPINPNGDSELALLMRQLFNDADSIKQLIEAGQGSVPVEFIEAIERVHTADPTDPEVKTDQFTAFNDMMKAQAERLKESTENQVEEFNNFVNSCISCHQVVCPGPIKRIKKLKIKN